MEDWIVKLARDGGSLGLVAAALIGAWVLVHRNIIVPGGMVEIRVENARLKVQLEESQKDVANLKAHLEKTDEKLTAAMAQIAELQERLAGLGHKP